MEKRAVPRQKLYTLRPFNVTQKVYIPPDMHCFRTMYLYMLPFIDTMPFRRLPTAYPFRSLSRRWSGSSSEGFADTESSEEQMPRKRRRLWMILGLVASILLYVSATSI